MLIPLRGCFVSLLCKYYKAKKKRPKCAAYSCFNITRKKKKGATVLITIHNVFLTDFKRKGKVPVYFSDYDVTQASVYPQGQWVTTGVIGNEGT